MADGPMGENVHGKYGPEDALTKEGQKPIPPKEYHKDKCFKGIALFRTMVNRIRSISFRIERKCSKGGGTIHAEECRAHTEYLKYMSELLNRQFLVVTNTCLNS